ncbi:MAG: glycosyltransferase family 2 protein [Paludibacteraceae bacterium]|nr:glycosyltransferase family 2 protein [Paludibacteraceae bacterium]
MEDKGPVISVIVPVYNASAYLEHCLDSIVSQTYTRLQIIVIDDSSTDRSASIIARYAARDSRITVLSQPHSGQAAARNLGLAHSNGEMTVFVDADDYITTNYLSDLYSQLGENDIVQGGYTKVTPQGKELYRHIPKNKHQFVSAWGRLYKTNIINGLSFPQGLYYEDVLFSIDVWERRPRIVLSSDCGYCYTLNPASTTSVSHPTDRKILFQQLRQRLSGADMHTKAILLYTMIRLRMHFMFR